MNRSYWSGIGSFLPGEKSVSQVGGVRLYDGEDRTDFESGVLQLTTHRLLWDDEEQEDSGGMISVTDVYCMYNRARGLELVSPDDVVSACQLFQSLDLPMRLRVFDSGVLVVQSLVHNEANVIEETSKLITEHSSLTAQELSNLVGVAIMLATERLLLTEEAGKACRDDSVEGLRFYPNKFIDQ
uniref:Vacuolar protein-sorting-associated protein 36 n=1 Tax=Amphimedon queenslandica TaxID=400682 RepID=A0A1X7V371_AMPQE